MKQITFSKNIFLPLTSVCANACGYCSFKEPVQDGCIMRQDDVKKVIRRGAEFGCTEALFTFGEHPEKERGFTEHLKRFGFSSILEYAYEMGKYALSCGLLPHTNAGVMSEEEMLYLREVNASMGLMLETTADVAAHAHSPTKDPTVRIEMIDTAGKLKIPFTTGLLLGIGETREDRIESLEVIRELYLKHKHIQEVIIQNFCPKVGTDMADIPGAAVETLSDTLQLAAEILPKEISIQIPPNLSDAGRILQYGVTDLGGVSPVTIDYINPEHPWPALDELNDLVSSAGYKLSERLCVYEKYCNAEWIDERILPLVEVLKKKVYG